MSPAPKFSTADIAKGAQQRQDERTEEERQAEQAREVERAERDRTSAPHIAGSEPAVTTPRPVTPGTPLPTADGTRVRTPTPGGTASSEPDAATSRPQETRAERDTDAAIARAATAGTAMGSIANTDRQLAEDSAAPLFATDAAMGFQQRWDTIQAGFVDDPRRAVEDADALVAETMQRLAETFAQERRRLEQEFARRPDGTMPEGSSPQSSSSTEDLRIALRHYRSFFKRLLSV